MRNLIDFITSHYHWFIFFLLEAVSLTLLCRYNGYQGAVWVSSANRVAGAVYEGESYVEHFFNLTRLNEELTSRNVYLEHQVKTLSDQLETATGDTAFAHQPLTALLAGYRVIPAKVVTASISGKDNLITINKGEADGIHKDMGVVSGTGVVGIVFMASAHYSIVIPVLSSKSSISCMIERRGYYGYLNWDGKASNLAYVNDIPRHAHFKLYDRVVTSGYSSVFPPGIPVGKILHVYNSTDGLSYRLQVQLYTDFSCLRDVCVIDDAPMQERLNLMRQAKDSLSLENNN